MTATTLPQPARAPVRWLKPLLGLGAVGLICIAAITVLSDPERVDQAMTFIESPFGLVGLFVLSALSSATLILPVPGLLLTAGAAMVANPLLVGVLAGAGQTVGELTGYLAGASGNRLAGDRLSASRMAGWMRRFGPATLFVLALVPNPVFDVAGVVAGALRMPVWQYLLATGAGKVIRNIGVALAAAHGVQLLAGS
jgi:membrane protein YqaA with SNARE-associated domain